MSRCFPFLSTGYVQNRGHVDCLVKSTKRDNIEEVKTESRKEKKREKKERRKERKEKEESRNKIFDGCVKDVNHKPGSYHSKLTEVEAEPLEKSGLTEEHEQPQNLCYLSDGTQSDKKRKREDSPDAESKSEGKPLRIRFVLKKPKESEAVLVSEQLCSTSGAEGLSVNENVVHSHERDTRTSETALESTSGQDEILGVNLTKNDKSRISVDPRKKRKLDVESQYKSLFENLLPPALALELNDDDCDGEWLFGTKLREKNLVNRSKTEGVTSSCGGSLWPQARFLPEAGIYSLPYTIPF